MTMTGFKILTNAVNNNISVWKSESKMKVIWIRWWFVVLLLIKGRKGEIFYKMNSTSKMTKTLLTSWIRHLSFFFFCCAFPTKWTKKSVHSLWKVINVTCSTNNNFHPFWNRLFIIIKKMWVHVNEVSVFFHSFINHFPQIITMFNNVSFNLSFFFDV